MASTLAHLELAFLFLLTLCVTLIPRIPVPSHCAFAAALLTTVQTVAARNMDSDGFEPAADADGGLFGSLAETVGLLVVPALTATLMAVVLYHLAAAYGFAHRRLRISLAARERGGKAGGAPVRRS